MSVKSVQSVSQKNPPKENFTKGETMNPTTQPNETPEPYELTIKAPTDDSLPAAQVLAELTQDADGLPAPRFIP
jgi:hypothetical protein